MMIRIGEWVNVSSGTGSPAYSRTKVHKMVVVVVVVVVCVAKGQCKKAHVYFIICNTLGQWGHAATVGKLFTRTCLCSPSTVSRYRPRTVTPEAGKVTTGLAGSNASLLPLHHL